MATPDKMERAVRAAPGLDDLPAIRARVARTADGDAFMDKVPHDRDARRDRDEVTTHDGITGSSNQ